MGYARGDAASIDPFRDVRRSYARAKFRSAQEVLATRVANN